MIRHSRRFAICALALFATSLLSASTLHFAGSSQLDDGGRKPGHYPYWSWGTELEKHMPAAHRVRNCAVGGQSTKSFRDSGLWQKLLDGVRPGDFVGIQFGANDQKCSTPFYREKRFAAPDGLFTEILRTWVADVRAKGATPILISHSGRCTFDKSGTRIVDWESAPGITLGTYTEATRRLAAELRCGFVDMQGLVRATSERLGRDEALKNYVISTGLVLGKDGEPSKDTTHPIKSGAEVQARLFLDDIRRQGLSVARLFDRAVVTATNDFDAAFAAVAAAGGGRVTVPRGVWKAGTIRLRDRCDLELAEGAVVECEGVVASGCTNVTISGTGTLRLSNGGAVVLSGCRGVRLRDFTLCGSSVAALQVVSSADVSIRGVTATAARGVDALTIAGSRDVTVEKCAFSRYDEEILRQEAKEALVRDLRVVPM